jgi:hypothetical protein
MLTGPVKLLSVLSICQASAVQRANKLTGANVTVVRDKLPGVMDIHAVQVTRVQTYVNRCGRNNGGCSHLCLPNEGAFSCACPTGLTLQSDSRTCNTGTEPFLNISEPFLNISEPFLNISEPFLCDRVALALPRDFLHQGGFLGHSIFSDWVWPPGDARQFSREPVSCDSSVCLG